jgi:multiple sugar transport system substrate-binding protein
MERLLFIMVILISTSLLSACNNQSIIEKDQQIDISNTEEKHEIIVWHTYSEEETKVFEKELIPLFEKNNPDIDIRPVRQSYSEQLRSALISRASSNKPPDIVRMDIAWVPKFIQLDLLLPLNHFSSFEKVKLSMQEESLSALHVRNNYYGIPLNTNTKVAIFNRQLLKRAGLESPPKTMGEIIKIAKVNDYRIGMSGIAPWESLPYFYSFGGKLFDPKYKKTEGYLNSKESVAAFEEIIQLYKSEHLNPNLLTGNPQIWQGILNGDYFMIDEGPWFYSVYNAEERKSIEKRTVAVPFPVTNGKGSIIGGESLVIMKGARNPENSWRFIKWMADIEAQQLLAKTGLIPANKNVDFAKIFEETPYYKPYIQGIKHSFLRPPIAEWDQIEEIYTRYFKLILAGTVDIQIGLNKAAQEIDQTMK